MSSRPATSLSSRLCSPELAAAILRICTDVPEGFDRAAFHSEFNAAVVQFFREQLAGGDR
jgi:predicted dienelactone hydrolase